MINIPPIASVESALEVYYRFPQLGNKEIRQIFGPLSSAKICQLKDVAREKMTERGEIRYNNRLVGADSAYQAWGIDIADLERRLARLRRLEKTNGKEHPRTEEAV